MRFSDTGAWVPRVWANRLTRSSSSIQRTSVTTASGIPARGGQVRERLLVGLFRPLGDGHVGRVPGRVLRQLVQPPLHPPQVAGQVRQAPVPGGGHEAGVDEPG